MVTPKIILNDDFLDLTKCPEKCAGSKSNTGSSQKNLQKNCNVTNLRNDGLRLEKELINCGLKKLVTSYNATAAQLNPHKPVGGKKRVLERNKSKYDPRFRRALVPEDKGYLNSVSDISITSKVELIFPKEKSQTDIESTTPKLDPPKNKIAVKKDKNSQERDSKQKSFDNTHSDPRKAIVNYVNQQSVDPRLYEKYSILKMPWKRTWTIPVFSRKSSTINTFKNMDHGDRQTYLYDDGTEIDSTYVEEKHRQIFSNEFRNQFMGLLFLGGSICGILLVSLLIWFIFGFDFFRIFFTPKEVPDVPIKKIIKYIGGSVVYMLANFFHTIARVLATPTRQVYQSPQSRYRWPSSNLPAE